MKKTVLVGLIMFWTLLCPILALYASPLKQQHQHSATELSHRFKFIKVLSTEQQAQNPFSQLSALESDNGIDLLTMVQKYLPTVHYFLVMVYAGLLIQFFFFFKRRLPFCYFLAPQSQHRYLSQGVLLI